MRIGLASVFLQEYPPLEALSLAAEAGYDCVELWADHLRLHPAPPAALRARAEELGLELSLHAPHYDLNPLAFNPDIRESSQRQLLEALELGAALGARIVVLHPGRLSAPWSTSAQAFDTLFAFAARLEQQAARLDVLACVELMENKDKEFFQTPEDGALLLAQKLPHIGLTVDIAHLHTLGDPQGAAGVLRRFQPRGFDHVHLSDSGPQATHLPLGQGAVNLAEVLDALPSGYAGKVIIEGYVPGRGKEIIRENLTFLRGLLPRNKG